MFFLVGDCGAKTQNTRFCSLLNMLKFTRFLGGPNEPKICGRKTKTDFKDRGSLEHKSKDKYTLSCTFTRQCCCILYCGDYELN